MTIPHKLCTNFNILIYLIYFFINLSTTLIRLDDGEDRDLSVSDMWLDAIARGTMETYVESILKIPRLTDAAALQLSTDIGRRLGETIILYNN